MFFESLLFDKGFKMTRNQAVEKQKKTINPFGLRVYDDLLIWLKHKAIDNHRSLNSEIVARLKESKRMEDENAKTV